jgi:hypothetical protein
MLLARRAQQWSHSCTAAAVMGRLHRPALLLRISTQRHHASSLVAAADRARDAARLRPPPPVVARYLATRAPDAYAVLGVARGLTDRDYKVAYLRKAKEWHPDLRPNDPTATKKFQELSAAYDEIKDSGARAAYDARARFQDTDRGYGRPRQQSAQQSAAQAAATWAEAWADAGALLEAAQAWWEEEYAALDEDVEEFSAAVTHRRLGDALDVVKRRSGLIVSVVVPALVLLRWPGAAVWVLRGVAPLATAVIGIAARVVLQNPRLLPFFVNIIRQVGGGLWRRAVARARRRLADRERRARRDEQRRKKHAQQTWERRRRGGP